MEPGTIVEKFLELSNSRGAGLILLSVILIVFFMYKLLKTKKVKLLGADERFKEAKLFASTVSSPMAIAGDGHIGIVRGAFAAPLILHLKDIAGYTVYFDGHGIAGSGEVEEGKLLFEGLTKEMEIRFREKTKKINLVFFMKDKSIVNIVLFSGGSKLISTVKESTQKEIKQLLAALEDVEKQIRKAT